MIEFKIPIVPQSKHYLGITVFDTHKEMVDFIRFKYPGCPPYRAIFLYHANEFLKGEIYFSKEYLLFSTVTHEVTHAALFISRLFQTGLHEILQKRLDIRRHQAIEEMFCFLVEYLNYKVLEKLKENNICPSNNFKELNKIEIEDYYVEGMNFYGGELVPGLKEMIK